MPTSASIMSNSSSGSSMYKQSYTIEATKSTKGASKLRRDLINSEIANLRDLLPLPASTRQRLSQLQLMALVSVYLRKSNYFGHAFPLDEVSPDSSMSIKPYFASTAFRKYNNHYNSMTQEHCISKKLDFGFSKALNGFMMMMTQTGKLLYISDNAAEYLGHSMEDLLIHGDSVYDIIESKDHATIAAELSTVSPQNGGGVQATTTSSRVSHHQQPMPTSDTRLFLCRMNVSRNARRQMRFGDQKVVLVEGHYFSYLPLCSRNEPVFLATCTPVAMPETRECVVQGSTNVFTSIHSMDMKFIYLDRIGEFYLGYDKNQIHGTSWYELVHHEHLRDAQLKHKRITQSDQERSTILLLRLQNKDGQFVWLHSVLQVKEASDSSSQAVIVCTNQVLSEKEAQVMKANSWLYQFYSLHSKMHYNMAVSPTTGTEQTTTASNLDSNCNLSPFTTTNNVQTVNTNEHLRSETKNSYSTYEHHKPAPQQLSTIDPSSLDSEDDKQQVMMGAKSHQLATPLTDISATDNAILDPNASYQSQQQTGTPNHRSSPATSLTSTGNCKSSQQTQHHPAQHQNGRHHHSQHRSSSKTSTSTTNSSSNSAASTSSSSSSASSSSLSSMTQSLQQHHLSTVSPTSSSVSSSHSPLSSAASINSSHQLNAPSQLATTTTSSNSHLNHHSISGNHQNQQHQLYHQPQQQQHQQQQHLHQHQQQLLHHQQHHQQQQHQQPQQHHQQANHHHQQQSNISQSQNFNLNQVNQQQQISVLHNHQQQQQHIIGQHQPLSTSPALVGSSSLSSTSAQYASLKCPTTLTNMNSSSNNNVAITSTTNGISNNGSTTNGTLYSMDTVETLPNLHSTLGTMPVTATAAVTAAMHHPHHHTSRHNHGSTPAATALYASHSMAPMLAAHHAHHSQHHHHHHHPYHHHQHHQHHHSHHTAASSASPHHPHHHHATTAAVAMYGGQTAATAAAFSAFNVANHHAAAAHHHHQAYGSSAASNHHPHHHASSMAASLSPYHHHSAAAAAVAHHQGVSFPYNNIAAC